jgi:hypothetical protein
MLMKERPSHHIVDYSSGTSVLQTRVETEDSLPNTFGRLSLDRTEASYVGSDHWAAIIDGVSLT